MSDGPDGPEGAVRPVGDAAVLVDTVDSDTARRLTSLVAAHGVWPGCDVVCGIRSVVLVMTEPPPSLDDALAGLADLLRTVGATSIGEGATAGPPDRPPPEVVIPTVFDGADLEEVASLVGAPVGAVIAALARAELRVAAVGFSPGFAYLSGLPDFLAAVPRRDAPRPVVPAGSVALANGFAAVYPQATPGGWQLMGRTTRRLFDPTTPPFAVLRPGDRVRLRPLTGPAVAAPGAAVGGKAGPDAAPSPVGVTGGDQMERATIGPPPGVPARIVVERAGLCTTVQDHGRPGAAHLGVPPSGPADPVAHRLANALVGNPPGAAALEATLVGPALRFRTAAHIAVVGGGFEPLLDGLPVGSGRVVPIGAGQQLVLGPARLGARGYLAVAGGLVLSEVLGSCASDTFTGIGPGRLRPGDAMGIGEGHGPLGDHLQPGVFEDDPAGPRHLRVLVGPDGAWFTPDIGQQLASAYFEVGATSDRVGIRLVPVDGGPGIVRILGEVESRGMVTGAVQVPPSGEPVILMPDHPTLGGYPVAAVVITADRGVLGRCRPGDSVRLVPVGPDEATMAFEHLARRLASAVAGRYPIATG